MKKNTLLLTFLVASFFANVFAQDSCATAVPLTPGTQQCGNTSEGADTYDDNNCLGNYDGGDDYMFSYTATATGETLSLTLSGVSSWTGFALIDVCPDQANDSSNCFGSDTGSASGSKEFDSDPLTMGVTYYVHISTYPAPQNTDFCLDAVVNPAPTCLMPSNIITSNVTSTSVDLSWDDMTAEGQFDFEYVIQADGLGVPTSAGISVSAFSVVGVTTDIDDNLIIPATDYEVWVRADCGGNDYSDWINGGSFTTECVAYVAPFLESFETNAISDCWVSGGDTAWEFGSSETTITGFAAYGAGNVPDHSISGTGTFIGMDGSDNTDGEISTLLTPLIDVSGLTTPYLSYYVFSNNVDDSAQNELLVEFFDGAAWNTIETIQANLGDEWVMYDLDLTTFTITGDVQVRFTVTGVSNGGFTYYNDILLDDIRIDELPTCMSPSGLTSSNITSSSVDIAWDDMSVQGQFDFEYVIQVQGIGVPTMAGTLISAYSVADISIDIDGNPIAPATAYEFWVRSDCGGGDYSDWVNGGAFTTECGVLAVPSIEDFENFLPNCWVKATLGDVVAGPSNFDTGLWLSDGFGNDGYTGAARINIYTTGKNDWLISPIYTIPSTGYDLVFDAAATEYNTQNAPTTPWESDDFVEVLVSTTDFTDWTVLYTYNDTNTPSHTGTNNVINLDAYSGQDIRIAFRGVEGPNNGSADIDFSIDNFEITDQLSSTSFVAADSFVVYPNPVKNILNLEYTSEISTVSVINLLGQQVLTKTINATATQLDVSQLNTGTYLVYVTAGNVQKTIKVVKQ